MTKLSIDNFNENELMELESFTQKYMNDTNSATNGDSLRMALSLYGIEKFSEDEYFSNFDAVDSAINKVYTNLNAVFDK